MAADVEQGGGKAHLSYAELTDMAAAEGVIDDALSAFGSIHGIVHSASIFDPRPLADTTFESLELQWKANVAAPLFMTKAAVPHLKPGLVGRAGRLDDRDGRLPRLHRVHRDEGRRDRARAARSASSWHRSGIRVNTVIPGYVRTPMLQPHLDANEGYEEWIVQNTPQGRIAGPEELAPNIVFMLSGLSDYVHGATLVVDGGWVAR